MRFVPVQLHVSDLAVGQANSRDALHFAPRTTTVDFLQVGKATNAPSSRNGLDCPDRSNDLKVHGEQDCNAVTAITNKIVEPIIPGNP